jgi:demethylmenaquinone methyltransferase/2-methoxy-6-polyprenyl-1,4-benzoquinol methylase/phosphoethanolamine N-methyltransferase
MLRKILNASFHTQPDETQAAAPHVVTRGHTISWAWGYDAALAELTLGQTAALRAHSIELAQIRPGETVLDAGCGTGDLTLALKRRVGSDGHVYGVDAAPEMIAAARQRVLHATADVDLRVAAVESLPFSEAFFDVVVSSLVFHHLPGDVQVQASAEIRRVLKPTGRLLIVDFRRPTTSLGRLALTLSLHGRLHIGVQDLAAQMSAAGFHDIVCGETPWRRLGFVRGSAGKH